MNPFPTSAFWLHTMATLALQVTGTLAAALGLHLFVKSARGRQVLWPASFLGMALVLVNFLAGIDRQVVGWVTTARQGDAPQFVVRTNVKPTGFATRLPKAAGAEVQSAGAQLPTAAVAGPSTTWWPGWLWLAGVVILAARTLGLRLWLVRFSGRNEVVVEPETEERVRNLAARLGLHHRVRLIELAALDSPIAFGWLRPSVGLPAGFWTAYSRCEQDAMLAHELAHLAARDPLWQMLADTVSVVLWWHPAVWWARRQLQEASETAADEASLLVENGPSTLAACLVALASRMRSRRAHGLLQMTGFRSGLGRRVERLLGFNGRDYPRFRRRTAAFVLLGGTGLGVGLALAVTTLLIDGGAGQPTLLALARQAVTEASAPRSESATIASLAEIAGLGTRAADAGDTNGAPQVSTVAQGTAQSVRDNLEAKVGLGEASQSGPTNRAISSLAGGAPLSPTALYTRTYRVDTNTVLRGLGRADNKGPVTTSPAELLFRYLVSAGAGLPGMGSPEAERRRQAAFRDPVGLGFADGTSWSEPPPASSPAGQAGKAWFYAEGKGLLLVRSTLADLDVIAEALELLNPASEQIQIQAWFVEITQEGAQRLANDQALASRLTAGATNTAGASNAPITTSGTMTGPQFSSLMRGLGGGTNTVRELKGDEIAWPGRTATNAHDLLVIATLGALSTNILSDLQFRLVMQALKHCGGVEVLAAPSMLTLNGRRGEIRVAEMRSVVAAVNPQAIVRPGAKPDTNVSTYLTTTVPIGLTLDVVPVLRDDRKTIDLDVTPTVTEFMGNKAPPKDAQVRVWEGGKEKSVDRPLARVRLHLMHATGRVADGQTLVLSGLTSESTLKFKDKVPVLGDIPLLGRLFRHEGQSSQTKTLSVFVRVVLVDPAGNPIHAVEPPSEVAR